MLHGLAFLAVNFFDNHLRLTYLQLITFTAHRLNEDGEVQDTASEDVHTVRRIGLFDAHGQILLQFGEQTVTQVSGSDIFALFPEERGVVDGEEHAHGRFIDLDGWQLFRIFGIRHGVADLEIVQTEQGADFAGFYRILVFFLSKSLKHIQFLDFGGLHAAVAFHQRDGLSPLDGSAFDTTHGDTSHVGGVVEGGDHHLQVAGLHFRGGDVLDDGVEEVGDVGGRVLPVGTHPTVLGGTIDRREIQLIVGGAEVEHQFEDGLLREVGMAVGLIDFVDDHDGLQSQLDGLLRHEAGLRHGSLEGIHHEEHAVGHVEHTLHLAAEVAVAWSVDHIDFHPLVSDGNIFGQNGDATFALQVVVVEH